MNAGKWQSGIVKIVDNVFDGTNCGASGKMGWGNNIVKEAYATTNETDKLQKENIVLKNNIIILQRILIMKNICTEEEMKDMFGSLDIESKLCEK